MAIAPQFKNLVRDTLASAGVHVSRNAPGHTRQSHLKAFLSTNQINCVLDVGAFIGDFAAELRSIGYAGRIISFEPVDSSFKKLSAHMSHDAGWLGQRFGLSSMCGSAQINTHASGDFNSLLALKQDARTAYHLPQDHEVETIVLKRLDEVLPALIADIEQPRIFLKMDTQGHDLDVMRGAEGVHHLLRGVLSELPAVSIYEGMPSMPQILEYFSGCGFIPVGFYPVNFLAEKQISPEFDVLFNAFDGSLSGNAAHFTMNDNGQ